MKTVAKTLLFDNNDRVLILYRSHTHPRYAHHADFPGGEVEAGESSIQAISREIKEETGLVVLPEHIKEAHVERVNDELIHVICETQLGVSDPTIELSWEHEGFEWMSVDDLKKSETPLNADDYYLNVIEYLDMN